MAKRRKNSAPVPHTLLIDADYVCYAAGFAVENTEYLVLDTIDGSVVARTSDWHTARKALKNNDGLELFKQHTVEDVSHALHSVKMMVGKIQNAVCEKFDLDEIETRIFLTGTANYRDRIASIRPYKGNRDPRHKPQYFRELRAFMIDNMSAEVVNWMEADDMVSILQTEDPGGIVVAGIDKDLLQVPGWHYVPGQEQPWKRITVKGGLWRFWMQVLTGDTTDNIAGCYKVGEVAAKRIVSTVRANSEGYSIKQIEWALWANTLLAYEGSLQKYEPEETGYDCAYDAAVENARLLYMLRETPKDAAYPELWNPPEAPK